MKGNIATLDFGNVSLESEKRALREANDEFYVFHHINDVSWMNGENCVKQRKWDD